MSKDHAKLVEELLLSYGVVDDGSGSQQAAKVPAPPPKPKTPLPAGDAMPPAIRDALPPGMDAPPGMPAEPGAMARHRQQQQMQREQQQPPQRHQRNLQVLQRPERPPADEHNFSGRVTFHFVTFIRCCCCSCCCCFSFDETFSIFRHADRCGEK